MKKLWNKFLVFLTIRKLWTKADEEEWQAKRAGLKAMGEYDPWAIDYGHPHSYGHRIRKEKDNV